MRRNVWGLLVVCVWIGCPCLPANGGVLSRTTIALTGQPAPGRAATFTRVPDEIGIKGGIVAFTAPTTVSGVYHNGLWVDRGEGLELAVFDKDIALGAGYTNSIWAPQNLAVSAGGDLAFTDMSGSESVWHSGVLSSVASTTMVAPGPVAELFRSLWRPSIDSSGHVAFQAYLTSQKGIWTNAFDSGLQAVAVTGQPAPGGGTYATVSTPVLAGGKVVHVATISDGGKTLRAVVGHTASGDELIARAGAPVASMPGYTYAGTSALLDVETNSLGRVAFLSDVTSAQGTKGMVMVDDGSGPAPVLREGQPAPGGGTFSSFSALAFNDSGRVAVTGAATGPGATGGCLWSNGIDGTFRLILSSADVLPDIPGDYHLALMGNLVLSDSGITAFTCTLADTPTPLTQGLFAQDRSGQLHLVAYEGQSIIPAPGLSPRTVLTLAFGGSQSVSGDTLIYSVTFTDGTSGVYTTTVPEPASLAMLLGAGAAVRTRRHRRAQSLRTPPATR